MSHTNSDNDDNDNEDAKESLALVNDGLRCFCENLRSIAYSRASFTLFLGFHPSCIPHVRQLNIKGLKTDNDLDFTTSVNDNNNNKFGSVLQESYTTIYNNQQTNAILEKDLTKSLMELLNTMMSKQTTGFIAQSSKATLLLLGDQGEEEVSEGGGEAELFFVKEEDGRRVPLGLVQVGFLRSEKKEGKGDENDHRSNEKLLLEQAFWKTLGRASRHLDLLLTTQTTWKKTDCLLLCVLVLATRDYDCSNVGGRFAVFACEPKSNNSSKKWRMSLLWRTHHDNNLHELSQAFGRYLHGVEYLNKEGAKLARPQKEEDGHDVWEYLGPDCTRVVMVIVENNGKKKKMVEKDHVLRVYDNRGRPTSRSPQVYWIEEQFQKVTKSVLVHRDSQSFDDASTMEFAEPAAANDDKWSMMLFYQWNNSSSSNGKKGGKIEVIAVPYYEGGPVCWNGNQAHAAVLELERFHKQNLVHGDIRGHNMVFSKDGKTVHIIDWDYGAPENSKRTYPAGYRKILDDGSRCGYPGMPITKDNDARDLAHVLGFLHTHLPNARTKIKALRSDLLDATKLEDLKKITKRMTAFFRPIRLIPSNNYQDYLNSWKRNDIT